MADIAANISYLKTHIPSSVRLVAVSKTKPVSDILIAYNTGQRCFGENRVQELLGKKDHLPSDIEWHLIGHLQSNKVKYIVPFIRMIESIDSYKLLINVNAEAAKINRVIDCLLQIHIAVEESKFGFTITELQAMIESERFKQLRNVRICGVMGMATFTSDTGKIRQEFRNLKGYFESLKIKYFNKNSEFNEISMGMSDDYEYAISEGSTIIRIGSLIFGNRADYNKPTQQSAEEGN